VKAIVELALPPSPPRYVAVAGVLDIRDYSAPFRLSL